MARRYRAISWEVKVFVAATPISGPALVYKIFSTSRESVVPTTFVMARVCHPYVFASFNAAIVSAVSPDCDIAITSVDSESTGFAYRNSELISTSVSVSYTHLRAHATRHD